LPPTQAESLEAETQSRCNPHEAGFVAALAAYLLRQGYAPSQLTILTPYCGQQLLIRRELHEQSARARASGGGGGGGGGGSTSEVHVSTVEQFAGEQSDLVLLSLVRSNETGAIGMLGVDSRVADALSRARFGLYIVGNASLLGAESALWESVLRLLKQARAACMCTARAQYVHSTQYARGRCRCKSVQCTRSARTAHARASVHAR
jgi:helicase required for RNAi-mediated heterochromatin assembly 1